VGRLGEIEIHADFPQRNWVAIQGNFPQRNRLASSKVISAEIFLAGMHMLSWFLAGLMTIITCEYIGLARTFVVAAACPILFRCSQRDWYVNSGLNLLHAVWKIRVGC
jgi:hypothetical protein